MPTWLCSQIYPAWNILMSHLASCCQQTLCVSCSLKKWNLDHEKRWEIWFGCVNINIFSYHLLLSVSSVLSWWVFLFQYVFSTVDLFLIIIVIVCVSTGSKAQLNGIAKDYIYTSINGNLFVSCWFRYLYKYARLRIVECCSSVSPVLFLAKPLRTVFQIVRRTVCCCVASRPQGYYPGGLATAAKVVYCSYSPANEALKWDFKFWTFLLSGCGFSRKV